MNFNQIMLLDRQKLNRALLWLMCDKEVKRRKNYSDDNWNYYDMRMNKLDYYSSVSYLYPRAFNNRISVVTACGKEWWCEWMPSESLRVGENKIISSPVVSSPRRAVAHMMIYIGSNYPDEFKRSLRS